MYRHALAARYVTHYLLASDRVAAARAVDHQIINALDRYSILKAQRALDHLLERRVCRRRGHYLYDVAVAELVLERNYPPVDLRPAARQPHLSVYGEGEIYRRRAARQLYHSAFRREAVDLL